MTGLDYIDRTSKTRPDFIRAPEFSLGDIVYGLTLYQQNKTRNCDVCGGTGRIKVQRSDHLAVCPEPGCRFGEITVTEDQRWFSIRLLTIRRVTFQLTDYDEGDQDGPWLERKVTYMAEETGVQAGQVWPEDQLFRTRTAAMERAEEHGAIDDGGRYLAEYENARFG